MSLFLLLLPASSWADWEYVSPMPHGRAGHDAAVGPDGRIYVMGGMVIEIIEGQKMGQSYYNGSYSNLVYDRNQDSWTYLEPVPGAVTAHNDKRKDGTPYGPNTFSYGNPNDGWLTVNEVYGEKNLYEIIKGPEHGKRIILDPKELRNINFRRQGDGTQIVVEQDGLIYWLGGNVMGQ